jgi:hypothetical protein
VKPSRCADNSGHRGGFFVSGVVVGGSLGKRVSNSRGDRDGPRGLHGRQDRHRAFRVRACP